MKILGSFAIIFGILCWIKSTRTFFLNNYPNLMWTAFVGFLATLLGVFLAFQLENYRQEKIRQDVFRYKLMTLLFETGPNIHNIKDMRKDFKETGINIKYLNSEVAKEVLSDPLIIEYGGQGLIYATSVMIEAIDTFNKNSDFVKQQFYLIKENSDKNLELISRSLDQAEYRIRIVQKILDFYNVELFKTRVKKEPDFDSKFYNWIHGKIDFTKEVQRLQKEELEKIEKKKKWGNRKNDLSETPESLPNQMGE